jgi:hypothetical protein
VQLHADLGSSGRVINSCEYSQTFGFDLGFEPIHHFLCPEVALNGRQPIGRHSVVSHSQLQTSASSIPDR